MSLLRSLQTMTLDAGRRGAQLVFAVNQSALAPAIDPLYRAAARVMLRPETPLSAELAAKTFPEDLFLEYRRRARKVQYFVEDLDFSRAQPERLTERQRRFVATTTLGETSGMAVSDGFLRAFRTSRELAPFFGTWFVEELNHFYGFHRYVAAMGAQWTPRDVERVAEVEFRPYSDDVEEIATCNMFQELVAFLVYRSFAKQVNDPLLAELVARIAKDELRHFRFYQDYVARHVQRHPAFRQTVLKVFLKATTPFNQVSGGARRTVENIKNGFFYFRAAEFSYFLDQVEFLLGDRLEPAFDAYFSLFAEPCDACGARLHRCACQVFEALPNASRASSSATVPTGA